MSLLRSASVLSVVVVCGGCSSSSSPSGDSQSTTSSSTAPSGGSTASSSSTQGGASGSTPGSGGGSSSTSGGGASTSGGGASGSSGSVDSGTASTGATLRIHYPVGTHTLTVRGAAAPLNWTTGTAPTAGANDTWTLSLPNLTAPAEWKPLLDDTTWAIGPNYHVAPGQTLDVYPHFTATMGAVSTLIADFHSTVLNDDRVIYAYLPASYTENTVATYPVVYMHDGQNLWAALPQLAFSATWNVDTAFDAASNSGTCSSGGVVGWGAQPLGGTPTTCNSDSDCGSDGAIGDCETFPEAIIIGVANDAERAYEYTPTVDPSEADAGLGAQGGADQYIQMLVTELKPQVDAMLRTRPDVDSTAMCGSSLGGLVTAYAGLKRPDIYGRIAAISPSSWWDNDVIVADVQKTLAAPKRPLVVYLDSGSGTADDEADTDMLAADYLALGYVANQNFRHVVQQGAQHSEVYWAQRFPGAMQLILGTR